MNVGAFTSQIDILEFVEASCNKYEWQAKKRLWASIEDQNANAIFSKHGHTVRSSKITIRSQPDLTLHNALALSPPDSQHFFLIDIDRNTPGFYVLSTVIIEPVTCVVEPTSTSMAKNNRPEIKKLPSITFPGYLTEKYLKQTQLEPMSYSENRYILVTPKSINIRTGELVKVGNMLCESVIPHILDPYKNEYEILMRVDN